MGGATRGGTAEPTSRDQKKVKNGDRERRMREKVTNRRKFLARKRRRRGRGASCDRAKGGIEHVRMDGRSQLPRTTYGRWRWMGRMELGGRYMF